MIIFINYRDKDIPLKINQLSSIYNLRQKIYDIIKKKENKVFINFNSKIIDSKLDKISLEKCFITNNSIIKVKDKLVGGVNWIKVFIIIFLVILIFIIFPLLLLSGILPFLLYVIELFVFKIITFILNVVFKLPRIVKHKRIFSVIIQLILLFFKTFFLYFGLEAAFKFVYFSWLSLIRGGSNIFTTNPNYCKAIKSVKMCAMASTIIFLIFYCIFKIPNILFGTANNFLSVAKRFGFGILFKNIIPGDPAVASLKQTIYKTKWKPIEIIPVFGQIVMAYFQGLEFSISMVQSILSTVVDKGCSGEPTTVMSINNNQAKEVVNKVTKEEPVFKEDDDSPFKLNVCCNPAMFQTIHNYLSMITNNKFLMGKLKDIGVSSYMPLLVFAFDTDAVNLGLQRFYDSFLIFKLMDVNVMAVAAQLFRYVLCNIFYIAQFTSNVLFAIGTPEDIADTIKCGNIAGSVSIIAYVIILIILIFIGLINK